MLYRSFSWRLFSLAVSIFAFGMVGRPTLSNAGCGCEKPPPTLASVRPNATYQGMPVTLFHSSLQTGVLYNVTFTAMNGQNKTVSALPVLRRDLANGQSKRQLVVSLPSLPLGPASISVRPAGQSGALLALPDTAFTVIPQPIVLPSQVGEYRYQNFQAAVGRNGVVYLSLDVSNITQPRTFKAQAKGYPLRFTQDSVVFYNTQGFLMQLLNMPGLASIAASNGADSDTLQYARHEFNTYFLQHVEQLPHATDPTDANWHLDGTRHIDHDYLILAIAGALSSGAAPAPGATPSFELAIDTHTLFSHGLVGLSSITLNTGAKTDSYNATLGLFGAEGDVLSNGVVNLSRDAEVNGNATAASFSIASGATITGVKLINTQPIQVMPVALPKGLPDLGNVSISKGQSATLVGPGSYKVSGIDIQNGGQWVIDNSAGPVTLYLTGQATILGNVITQNPDPEEFAVYIIGNGDVRLMSKGSFYGVIYAPNSSIDVTGLGELYGSFIGYTTKLGSSSRVHYDTLLRGY